MKLRPHGRVSWESSGLRYAASLIVAYGLFSCTSTVTTARLRADPRRGADLFHCWRQLNAVGFDIPTRFCFLPDRYLVRIDQVPWFQADVQWTLEPTSDGMVRRTRLHFDASAEPITVPGSRELVVRFSSGRTWLYVADGPHTLELVRVSDVEERGLLREIERLVPVRRLCEQAKACTEVIEPLLAPFCLPESWPCFGIYALESTSKWCDDALEAARDAVAKHGIALPAECGSTWTPEAALDGAAEKSP